jgi:adenylate kinase
LITTKIAEAFNMANVSTSNLIKDMLGNSNNSSQHGTVKQKIESGEMISDHMINELMQERLSRIDCKSMGFCLEGYPRTEVQSKFMKNVLRMEPDIVFVLDCPDHII